MVDIARVVGRDVIARRRHDEGRHHEAEMIRLGQRDREMDVEYAILGAREMLRRFQASAASRSPDDISDLAAFVFCQPAGALWGGRRREVATAALARLVSVPEERLAEIFSMDDVDA